MPTEEVASRRIRSTTSPRVRSVILAAREKKCEGGKKPDVSVTKGLKDGDVLLKRSSGTPFNRIISGVSKSPHTHAAIYSKGNVYDIVKGGKGRTDTLEGFGTREKGITYDVFRPKEKEAAMEAARNVERITDGTKGYSYASLVQAGLRDRFGFGITTNYDKNYKICSELVYDCFNGRIGNDASSSVSPGRLATNRHLEKVDSLKLSLDELRLT